MNQLMLMSHKSSWEVVSSKLDYKPKRTFDFVQDEIGVVALDVGIAQQAIPKTEYHAIALWEMVKKRAITAGKFWFYGKLSSLTSSQKAFSCPSQEYRQQNLNVSEEGIHFIRHKYCSKE